MRLRAFVLSCFLAVAGSAHAMKVKDIANVSGVRFNQLVGYGLVVGLDGTGDQVTQTPYTSQSLSNMLGASGINLSADQISKMQSKNVASVVVSAQLPPFVKAGQTIDITVSSMGNAKSLKGGVLVMTPLKGADGLVYAIGQGTVTVSNLKTGQVSGIVNNGALVEREVPFDISNTDSISFELKRTDFTLISRLKDSINRDFGREVARAVDGRIIKINTTGFNSVYDLIAKVENVEVPQIDAPAKVTIHSRTGAVVMNKDVEVAECAITHGNISLQVGGESSNTNASNKLVHLKKSARLNDVIKALNSLGVTATDLVAILQAMSSAGSLNAELEII